MYVSSPNTAYTTINSFGFTAYSIPQGDALEEWTRKNVSKRVVFSLVHLLCCNSDHNNVIRYSFTVHHTLCLILRASVSRMQPALLLPFRIQIYRTYIRVFHICIRQIGNGLIRISDDFVRLDVRLRSKC